MFSGAVIAGSAAMDLLSVAGTIASIGRHRRDGKDTIYSHLEFDEAGGGRVKPESFTLICRNPSGITPIFIDTAARVMRLETGHPIEFRDGAKQYVRVTNDVIEFGCRTLKTDGEMIADGMAWLLGDNSKGAAASDTMCLSRHRIDRHTGIWTASRRDAVTGPMADAAECRRAPQRPPL
jgi:hypothetical protein